MITTQQILNPDPKGISKEEMLTELEREYTMRMRVYPKWVDSKLTRTEAHRQMQRLKASILLIREQISKEQGEQKELFKCQKS